jgi:N-acetylglutamate synthase
MNIAQLEEIAFPAWAALETERYDGWVLRFANGYTGRANSVNPIYPSSLDLQEKIAYCQRWYAERGIQVRYRLNNAMHPPELDDVLKRLGYVRESDSKVMTVDLSNLLSLNPVHKIKIGSHPSDDWLANFCVLHPTHAPHIETMQSIFKRIEGQKYFATVVQNGEAVAMGLGVREGSYVGLFDIVTRTDQRGKGYGKALVQALLDRAREAGASIGYLQVAANNAPAIKLYEGIGFQKAYDYWYRKPG